jgi:hypothetical protein
LGQAKCKGCVSGYTWNPVLKECKKYTAVDSFGGY